MKYAGVSLSLGSLLPATPTILEDTPSLAKYWSQRFRLFSKYSEGIQLDHGETNTVRLDHGETNTVETNTVR